MAISAAADAGPSEARTVGTGALETRVVETRTLDARTGDGAERD